MVKMPIQKKKRKTSDVPVIGAGRALSLVVGCSGGMSTVHCPCVLGIISDKLSERLSGSLMLRILTEVEIIMSTSERMDSRTEVIGCLWGILSVSEDMASPRWVVGC